MTLAANGEIAAHWLTGVVSRYASASKNLQSCFQVPDEYLTASRIGGKVPVVELQRSHTDLLFFNFYAGHGDRLQLTAASLLFERGWRFNIPNQVQSSALITPRVLLMLF